MSRVCELTGKAVMSGNNVSHAVNKTRRKFLPNLQQVSLPSEKLGKALKFGLAHMRFGLLSMLVVLMLSF